MYTCRCGCGKKYHFVFVVLTHEVFFCKNRNDESKWLTEEQVQENWKNRFDGI